MLRIESWIVPSFARPRIQHVLFPKVQYRRDLNFIEWPLEKQPRRQRESDGKSAFINERRVPTEVARTPEGDAVTMHVHSFRAVRERKAERQASKSAPPFRPA